MPQLISITIDVFAANALDQNCASTMQAGDTTRRYRALFEFDGGVAHTMTM
jgi:hypothetical protein